MLSLPDTLTHALATACLARLQEGARTQEGPAVALNAAALRHFDSSALAVLLELRRSCQEQGRVLALEQVPPRLTELARLYGIEDLLPCL